jgi:GNAT superfamily N-acetyltransferase
MPIAFRHRDDGTSFKPPVPGLAVHREIDPSVMARLQGRGLPEIQERFDRGHRAYVATMDGTPAAWGWVATSSATIGELEASFAVPSADRYLWNFVTLAAFRGRGIYPRLLDAIVTAESVEGEHFWIAYAPENHASGTGIMKAGFVLVADLSFDRAGRPVVRDIREGGGDAASRLLGLPSITEAVAQCWKCARGPEPSASSCATGSCSCDYQRAERACTSEAA